MLQVHIANNIDKLIDIVNDTFNLNIKSADEIITLSKMQPEEIDKYINNLLPVNESLILAFSNLYHTWVDCIKFLIMSLSKLINGSKRINFQITPEMKSLLNYEHKGFCKYKPISRLQDLLEFPVEVLVDAIKQIDPKELNIDIRQMQSKILSTIKKIDTLIENNSIKMDFMPVDVIIPKSQQDTRLYTIDEVKKHIGELIQKIIDNDPNKKEEIYIDIAKHINSISQYLQTIFDISY